MKQGRNEKCSCGSGKKFKNCCFKSETQVSTTPGVPQFVNTMFNNGNELLKSFNENYEETFQFDKDRDTNITCLGLEMILKNPNTNKYFSVIVSDEVLTKDEINMRWNFSKSVNGDLNKLGNLILDQNPDFSKTLKENKPIRVELLNGVEWNNKHPDTFHIPSSDDKKSIQIGTSVKVVDTKYNERFWVEIVDFITEDLLVGRIDNELMMKQPYSLGDKIFLKLDNVIDIFNENYQKWLIYQESSKSPLELTSNNTKTIEIDGSEYVFSMWESKDGEDFLRIHKDGLWFDSIPDFPLELFEELVEDDFLSILNYLLNEE
jgi:hypothetical protein